jgi:hypothetical protein
MHIIIILGDANLCQSEIVFAVVEQYRAALVDLRMMSGSSARRR